MNIAQLVTEAKQGNTAAQQLLFTLLADKMLLVCRRYVKNREDAEEVLQDGFYKFFKNLPGFQYMGDAALVGWLKKIMINECLMLLRKKNVFRMVAETAAEDIPLQEDALNRLSAAEIINLIMQLPVGYRTVFNLHVVEGMEHGEIARLLGIAEGTSKSQLSKAKSLLQKMLLQKSNNYEQRKAK
jgi:RNA polymerase sigma-70 factor (ECF subfamily)